MTTDVPLPLPLALSVDVSNVPLARVLRVANFTLTSAHTVIVRVRAGDVVGYGESAPLARYGDFVEDIVAFYAGFALAPDASPFARDGILANVPRAARCALDIALFDLAGRMLGASVTDMLGLAGLTRPPTSLTVPIDETAAVVEHVRELRDAPVLKVKVGSMSKAATIELFEAIRSVYSGEIRIDANEGWTPEQAVDLLGEIERFGIQFCEQPIPAGSPEGIAWIAERSKIPIMIDEDAVEARQLPAFHKRAHAVNVKLAKCGGIGAAYRMIATARALGFKVMIGCMAETRILATAAAHLGPLADWLDIDGPLLLASDPYRGVDYDNGRLIMPEGSGLGVGPVAPAAC
jgi:L-alanine-DL-glutamate epimerase-like enolase superfamily enzyme